MKKTHHALTITAADDLLKFWTERDIQPDGVDLKKTCKLMEKRPQVRLMERWVAQADELDDLIVEEGLASIIVDQVSKATSFQHFAYCGSMGELEDGDALVKQYDGYCWDCDPFLSWYEEIANMSWADVRFSPKCGVFDEDFFIGSPGMDTITGDKDWDNQLYPSAIDMAVFYGERAQELKNKNSLWAIQSLCFAVHMLQDMAVPHHVLCTVRLDHVDFEDEMLGFWKRLYSNRSESHKATVLERQIGPQVTNMLEGQLGSIPNLEDLGGELVDMTRERLPNDDSVPSRNKVEAGKMTVQAIACTIKAMSLFQQSGASV